MKKIILSLSLLLVILSCTCEMPTESVTTITTNDYFRVTRASTYNNNQLTGYVSVKYNSLGLLMRLEDYITNTNTNQGIGQLTRYLEFEYDSANRIIRQSIFATNGELEESISYVRSDTTGRAARIERHNSNGEMIDYSTIEYSDDNTRRVTILYDTNDVVNSSNITQLDPSSFDIIIQEEECLRGRCSLYRDYEYLTNRLVRRNVYTAGSVSSYRTYKYDLTNNRLERMEEFSSASNLTGYSTFEYENFSSTLDFIQIELGYGFKLWYPL